MIHNYVRVPDYIIKKSLGNSYCEECYIKIPQGNNYALMFLYDYKPTYHKYNMELCLDCVRNIYHTNIDIRCLT